MSEAESSTKGDSEGEVKKVAEEDNENTKVTKEENTARIVEHVKQYLENDDTDYAISIDGNWGCGKTYFILNKLVKNQIPIPVSKEETERKSKKETNKKSKEKAKEEAPKGYYKFVYLSLFGLKSDESKKALAVKLCYQTSWFMVSLTSILSFIKRCPKNLMYGGSLAFAVLVFLLIYYWPLSLLCILLPVVAIPAFTYVIAKLSPRICSKCRDCKKIKMEDNVADEAVDKGRGFFFKLFHRPSKIFEKGMFFGIFKNLDFSCPDDDTLLENGLIAWLSSIDWKGGDKAVHHAFALAKNSVIILDDLERAVNPLDHLSLINRLAEHYGIHVVVIKNDKDIKVKQELEYNSQKEKAIRFGYRFTPDIDDIYSIFFDLSRKHTNAFTFYSDTEHAIKSYVSHLMKNEGKCLNLRILKMVIQLFNPLYEHKYSEKYSNYFSLFTQDELNAKFLYLFKMLYFISSQIHECNVKNDEDRYSNVKILANNTWSINIDKTIKEKIEDNYIGKYFDNDICSNHIYWDNLLEVYATENRLDFASFYKNKFPGIEDTKNKLSSAEALKILDWSWVFDATEEDFKNSFNKLWRMIKDGEINHSGSFLTAARMFEEFIDYKVIDKTKDDVHDLLKSSLDKIDITSGIWDDIDRLDSGSFSDTYLNYPNSKLANEILEILRKKALENQIPKYQEKIVEYIKNDKQTLFDYMSNPYKIGRNTCIFNEETFGEFWGIIENADGATMHTIKLMIGIRWEAFQKNAKSYPQKEREYYQNLYKKLKDFHESTDIGLKKYKLQVLINNLKPIVEAIEKLSEQDTTESQPAKDKDKSEGKE